MSHHTSSVHNLKGKLILSLQVLQQLHWRKIRENVHPRSVIHSSVPYCYHRCLHSVLCCSLSGHQEHLGIQTPHQCPEMQVCKMVCKGLMAFHITSHSTGAHGKYRGHVVHQQTGSTFPISSMKARKLAPMYSSHLSTSSTPSRRGAYARRCTQHEVL